MPCLRSSWDITELWWSDVGNLTATVDDIHEAYARQRILLAAR